MSQTQLTEYNETNMVIQQLMITNRQITPVRTAMIGSYENRTSGISVRDE